MVLESPLEGKNQKRVFFTDVEIREYPIVLDDNPASRYGPSIALGWEYIPAPNVGGVDLPTDGKISVSEYERVRPDRLTARQLYLYLPTRASRMTEIGYSDDDIESSIKDKKSIRKSRERSNRLRNPTNVLVEIHRDGQRHRKIQRAVRNMRLNRGEDRIYAGWWLPFSAFIL